MPEDVGRGISVGRPQWLRRAGRTCAGVPAGGRSGCPRVLGERQASLRNGRASGWNGGIYCAVQHSRISCSGIGDARYWQWSNDWHDTTYPSLRPEVEAATLLDRSCAVCSLWLRETSRSCGIGTPLCPCGCETDAGWPLCEKIGESSRSAIHFWTIANLHSHLYG